MIPKRFKVPYEFLEACAEKYCADTLDTENTTKSRGEMFEWKRRHWVTIGGASQYLRWLEATLCLVVPETVYDGPPHDPEAGPGRYYQGVRLTCKKQVWVMTTTEITLFPILERRNHVSPVPRRSRQRN